jgi:hypothetical protein
MQLKVIKSDGSIEEYLHTKVIGTFNNALASINQSNVFAAEQFAEAITFYLYRKNENRTVNSDQIHLMVQAILDATGYQNAARALSEYHLNRRMKRKRIEVVDDVLDPERDWIDCMWNKSHIVTDLTHKGIDRQTARAIGSAVEEKILNLGISRVRRSLIKELVAIDSEAMLEAQRQLQGMTS